MKDKFTNETFQRVFQYFHNSWWSNMKTSSSYPVNSKNTHQLKHTKVKSISHLMSQESIVLWNNGLCSFCHVHGRVQVLLSKTGGALLFGCLHVHIAQAASKMNKLHCDLSLLLIPSAYMCDVEELKCSVNKLFITPLRTP